MRTKKQILDSTRSNSESASTHQHISLIHELHTLEVLIDIRDFLERITSSLMAIERRQVK